MALSPSEKATFKKEIAQRLSPQSWAEIDLVLTEFGAPTTPYWDGDGKFSYIVEMLKNIDDAALRQLAVHLNIDTGENGHLDLPTFWGESHLRVFISHLAKNKVYASELQAALSRFGISCFVAHEDIEPDAEWQTEIEKALRTCDALVALLHEGFHESTWTDQEIGYALGRGVPVSSIRIDIAPYGLFGKKQAFNGKNKDVASIARELLDAYRKHPKTRQKVSNAIIETFCKSSSFAEAKANCELVEQLIYWEPNYKERLHDAVKTNSQVSGAWGVPARIDELLAKHHPDAGAALIGSDGDEEIPF